MKLISHKMSHEPVYRYMIDHFAYGHPAKTAYLHPIACAISNRDGHVIDEYNVNGDTWVHNAYVGEMNPSRISAQYVCEYEDIAISLLFTMEQSEFPILNAAINIILQVYFKEFRSLKVGECKTYTDLYYNKITVTRMD